VQSNYYAFAELIHKENKRQFLPRGQIIYPYSSAVKGLTQHILVICPPDRGINTGHYGKKSGPL
jgi:hypothetical protein